MVVKENYTCYLQESSLYNIYVANGFDETESWSCNNKVTNTSSLRMMCQIDRFYRVPQNFMQYFVKPISDLQLKLDFIQ